MMDVAHGLSNVDYVNAIYDSTVEGIITVGLDGMIKTANRSACRMLGHDDASELIDRHLHASIHHKKQDGSTYPVEACPLIHALKTAETMHLIDEVLWRRDGSSFHADFRLVPLRLAGDVIGGVVTFCDTSEQRRIKDELILNQAWLSATLTGTGDAVVITDAQTPPRVEYMNPVGERLTGWSTAEAHGLPINEVCRIVSTSGRDLNLIHDVIATGKVVGLQKDQILIARNGDELFIESSVAPIRGATGQLEGAVQVFRDVTEERVARLAQENYQRWLERAIKELPTPVCMADPQTGEYIFGNDALNAMMGRTLAGRDDVPVRMAEMSVLDPVTGLAIEVSDFPSSRAARGEVVKDFELIWLTSTGRYDVSVTAHTIPPLYGDDGTIMLAVTDNTALKLVQRRLQESETRLNLALDGAGMGTWHIDLMTGVATASATTAEIFGHPPGQGNIFELIAELVHPDDVDEVNRVWLEAVGNNKPYVHEYRAVRPDGTVIWVYSRGRTQVNEAGTAVSFSGVIVDVTERKLAENALAVERARLNAVFEESPVGMALMRGRTFVFEKINAIFAGLVGERDYLGRAWREVYPELIDSPLPSIMTRVLETGQTYQAEDTPLALRDNDGVMQPHFYTFTYSRVDFNDERGPGILVQCMRTTESVLNREKAAQISHRLASVVEIAQLGFYDWDVALDRVDYSARMKQDWQIDDHTPLSVALARIHVEDRERVSEAISHAFTTNEPYRQEYRIVLDDGSVRWIEAAGEIEYSREGKPTRFFGTSLDVTERKAIENSLIFERNKLEAMFQHSPAAMAFWRGPDFTFEKINSRYQAIFAGRTLIGRPLLEVAPELDGQPFPDLLRRVLRTGDLVEGDEMPAIIHQPSGEPETRYFDFTYLRINDPHGDAYGVYTHAIDVTDRVKARAELEISKNVAEMANQTKSSFLANMSHEIRTPLGAILGFTDLLKEDDITAEDRQAYLETISRNGKALTRIIDDILDLAKVESGQLEIEKIEFSLRELIDDVVDLFRESTKARAIYLRHTVAPDLPERIVSDPTRLRQIMINIVGNAVKFTHEGGVTIDIRRHATDTPGINRFELVVRDTGVGLTAEQRERLFKPFVQADNSTTRKFGGTGLGLALSKRLAIALGGDVKLSPSNEGGSTFCISFLAAMAQPTRAPVASADLPPEATEHAARLKGRRILVADDSADNQFLIDLMLRREGAQVEMASNGQDAFRLGINGRFDVVLMDIQMPEMDGYEATRALRDAGFKKPIIALTAHAMAEERARSLAAGCNGHLTKPIDRDALVIALQMITAPRGGPVTS